MFPVFPVMTSRPLKCGVPRMSRRVSSVIRRGPAEDDRSVEPLSARVSGRLIAQFWTRESITSIAGTAYSIASDDVGDGGVGPAEVLAEDEGRLEFDERFDEPLPRARCPRRRRCWRAGTRSRADRGRRRPA